MTATALRAAALSLCVSAGLAAPAFSASLTSTYSSFWVLGDSLSDNGNLFAASGGTVPASPPYVDGRFSNGAVWNEGIIAEFGAAGQAAGNFAFGGARADAIVTTPLDIPDLADQRALFDAAVSPAALGTDPLVALWFGANDIFNAIDFADASGFSAADATNAALFAAGTAANAVELAVRSLNADHGINDFVLFNLPDFGALPAYTLGQPDNLADARAASLAFNATLDASVAALEADGYAITYVDVFGFSNGLAADPSAYLITDTVFPCILGATVCDTPNEKLFFDGVHPSATVHAAFEQLVRQELSVVPLPPAAAMLLLALGALGGVAARRKAG